MKSHYILNFVLFWYNFHKVSIRGSIVPQTNHTLVSILRHKRIMTYKLRYVVFLGIMILYIEFETILIILGSSFNFGALRLRNMSDLCQVPRHVVYYCWPNHFVYIIFGLFRSQICVFINFHFCFILCLHFVHNLYEFSFLLAKS